MRSRKKRSPVLWFGLLLVCGTVLYFFLSEKYWQVWQVDHAWCQEQIESTTPLQTALEKHRQIHGAYPRQLNELPEPVENFTGDWRYQPIGKNNYQLSLNTLHFAGSYDSLIYRHSQKYPAGWEQKCRVIEMGEWLYLIGGQPVDNDINNPMEE